MAAIPLYSGTGFVAGSQAERDCQVIRKTYPKFNDDIDSDLQALAANAGEKPDQRIPGLGDHRVFKRRTSCSDSRRGKSGGYRIVYIIHEQCLIVLRIYNKLELENVPSKELGSVAAKTLQLAKQPPNSADAHLLISDLSAMADARFERIGMTVNVEACLSGCHTTARARASVPGQRVGNTSQCLDTAC